MMLSSKPKTIKEMTFNPADNLTESHSLNNVGRRPHSITPVTGKQIKTRMSCNHMKPRCEDCLGSKKRHTKRKHKPLLSNPPRPSHFLPKYHSSIANHSKHSHVLPSTRSHPRGSTDGRKLYEESDGGNSLSKMDVLNRLSRDASAGNILEKFDCDFPPKVYMNKACSELPSEEGSKKKVQFADALNGRTKVRGCESVQSSQISNSKSSRSWSCTNGNKSKQSILEQRQREHTHKGSLQEGQCHSNEEGECSCKEDFHQSSSTSDQGIYKTGGKGATSKMWKSNRPNCSKNSRDSSESSSSREHYFHRQARSHSLSPSSSSSEEESCLLCQRYSGKHYEDSDYCCFCEVPFRIPRKSSDFLAPASSHLNYHPQKTLPVPRKGSIPFFPLNGENNDSLYKTIPYEPKTDVVKDLKKRLEDDYLHKNYLHSRRNPHRRWRSWDVEDLEELRCFRQQRCKDHLREYVPQHKCVHRYLQNDRLFLEPTVTDEEGNSLCSECGDPQSGDHVKKPYLYHFTLGGLCDSTLTGQEKQKGTCCPDSYVSKSCKERYSIGSRISSKRLPGDTSKHLVFAKLNSNVHSILPKKSPCYTRQPHLADELHYRIDSHTRRHPSKSMALVDHLI